MFEALSIIIFAGVMYFCLVVVPSAMELFASVEFKKHFFMATESVEKV